MNIIRSKKLISASVLSILCASAFGQLTAFSNIGNAQTGGWLVNGTDNPIFQFTSAATGSLSGFLVNIQPFNSGGAPFTLNLYADNGSNAPDATPLAGGFVGSPNGGYVSVAASGAILTAGDKYWLQATSQGSDVWIDVTGGGLASTAQNYGNGSDTALQTPGNPAFTATNWGELPESAVYVTPLATPEPSMLPLGLGIAGLALRRARRRTV